MELVELKSQTEVQIIDQNEKQIQDKIKKAVENNTLFPPDDEE